MTRSCAFTAFILMILSYHTSFCQRACFDIRDNDIKKTALVIGQSNYVYYDTLPGCSLDANGMADALRRSGFSVSKYQDLNFESMLCLINDWCLSLPKYDVAVFYYSGHGVEVDSMDYMVPLDSRFYTNADVKSRGYSLSKLIDRLDSNKHLANIVLLDACRGRLDASKSWRLGDMKNLNTKGTYLGFAASPGELVFPGPRDSLSFYTKSLIDHIKRGFTLKELFTAVNEEVSTMTQQAQIPQSISSAGIDICLGPPLDEE